MKKYTLRLRSAGVLIWGIYLLSLSTFAQADGNWGEKYRHGNYNYRHHDGMWYTRDEVFVRSAPSIQVNL